MRNPAVKNNGFTLVELLIVISIVAVLAGLSYPVYVDSVKDANRDSAKAGLMLLASEMGRAKTVSATNNYANLTQGGGVPIPTLFPSQLPMDSGTKTYDITIATDASANQFTLTATPIDGALMEGDGALTLSSTGAKTLDGNPGWDRS